MLPIFQQPGASMGTSAKDGWQVFGAGFIQAEKDSDCYIGLEFVNFQDGKLLSMIYVWAKKIEWDKRGKTVAVHGLRPIIGHTTNGGADFIKIADNTADPKVVDGKLYLKLAAKPSAKGDQQVVLAIPNFSRPHPSGVGIIGTIQ